MRASDLDTFAEMLDAVCGLLSRGAYRPSDVNTALWFRALVDHDIATVRAAFDAHVRDPQRGRFVPTPADLIAQIQGADGGDGRPGPEEAFALALRGADEAVTIVWTDETAQAWAIAKPVMDLGDEVGARMAFREAYGRLVDAARRERRPANWSASLGFDLAGRAQALDAAHSAGLLPAPDLLALPAPVESLAALTACAPPHIREKLAEVREKLTSGASRSLAAAEEDRRRTAEAKAEAQRKVDGAASRQKDAA